jgi:hypothetical protein
MIVHRVGELKFMSWRRRKYELAQALESCGPGVAPTTAAQVDSQPEDGGSCLRRSLSVAENAVGCERQTVLCV